MSALGLVDAQEDMAHPGSPQAHTARHPGQLTVCVSWASDDAISGYHFTAGISVSPAPAPKSRTPHAPRLAPVKLHLVHPASVIHDFTPANPTCRIPISVMLTNSLSVHGGSPLDFRFQKAPDATGSPLSWLGNIRHSIRALAPADSETLNLCACVSSPGVYELNEFEVLVDGVSHRFSAQYLVTVQQQQ